MHIIKYALQTKCHLQQTSSFAWKKTLTEMAPLSPHRHVHNLTVHYRLKLQHYRQKAIFNKFHALHGRNPRWCQGLYHRHCTIQQHYRKKCYLQQMSSLAWKKTWDGTRVCSRPWTIHCYTAGLWATYCFPEASYIAGQSATYCFPEAEVKAQEDER